MWFSATPLTLVNITADEYPAVRLDGDGMDGIVRARSRVEVRVHRTIRVQAGDVVEIGVAVDGGEIAADDHLAVTLHREGIDRAVGAQARIEGGVQRTVGIEPGNSC